VKEKWHAEIRAHCPSSPIILVGTKLDLRSKSDVIANLKKNGMFPGVFLLFVCLVCDEIEAFV
jgi:GTPase SAR1 family protein